MNEKAGALLDRLGMDGKLWAEEFAKTARKLGYSDMDGGWLHGWFCNAIMAGYDEARRRYEAPEPMGAPMEPAGTHSAHSTPEDATASRLVEHERDLELVAQACEDICKSRSRSLHRQLHEDGVPRISEANEAHKCSMAIRSNWRLRLNELRASQPTPEPEREG